jgi:MFS family permease
VGDKTLANDRPWHSDVTAGGLTLRQQTLIIVGAALGMAFGYGPVFLGVAGIFLKPMAASFGWSRADVAVLPMLSMIGSALGAPLIGYMADRKGWGKVIAFAVGFLSLGLLAIALAPPSHTYIISVGFLIGMVGVATTPAGYNAVIALVFERRLGMALGFAAIGIGVGVMSMPIVAAKLIGIMDWREAYACLAGASLLAGLTAHRLIFRVLHRRSAPYAGRGRTEAPNAAGEGVSLAEAMRSYRFWLIGIVAAIVSGTTLAALIHLVSYATDRGVSIAAAAQSAGLMGVGVAITRVGVGVMLDKVFAPFVAFASIILSAAGFFLITGDIVQSAWLLPVAAVLVGISQSAEGDLLPFLARKYFGVRAFGSIYGALFFFVPIGGAMGTYVYGWSFDLLKSYIPIFQISAVLLCVGALAMLMLGRYSYPAGKDQPSATMP